MQADLGDYLCNSKSRCINLNNMDSTTEFDLLSGNPVECVVHPDLWNKTKLWDPLGIGKNLVFIFHILFLFYFLLPNIAYSLHICDLLYVICICILSCNSGQQKVIKSI